MFGCCNNLFSCLGGCSSCNRCCRNGGIVPPVPMPPAPPAPTPPAPPQLRGAQLSLVGSSAGTIAHGASVPFDTVNVNNSKGISYTPSTGNIILARTGTYLVNWWVSPENTQGTDGVTFALALNGTVVQTSAVDVGGGQISGSALVTVGTVPSTLTLVNESGGAITYAKVGVQGGVTVTQLA